MIVRLNFLKGGLASWVQSISLLDDRVEFGSRFEIEIAAEGVALSEILDVLEQCSERDIRNDDDEDCHVVRGLTRDEEMIDIFIQPKIATNRLRLIKVKKI